MPDASRSPKRSIAFLRALLTREEQIFLTYRRHVEAHFRRHGADEKLRHVEARNWAEPLD